MEKLKVGRTGGVQARGVSFDGRMDRGRARCHDTEI